MKVEENDPYKYLVPEEDDEILRLLEIEEDYQDTKLRDGVLRVYVEGKDTTLLPEELI